MAVDGLRSRDLGLLVDAADGLMPAEGRRYWFIDEITGIADDWPNRMKWLRDNDARFRTDTVVLTGSSAADLTLATKALAGRRGEAEAPDRVLLPIGFRSFVGSVGAETPPALAGSNGRRVSDLTRRHLKEVLPELAPWQDVLIRAWETYLRCGGFPAAVARHVASRESPQHCAGVWLTSSTATPSVGPSGRKLRARTSSGDRLRTFARRSTSHRLPMTPASPRQR